MLGDQNIVAFVPTSDFSRAKAFYQGKLGLVEVRASDSRGMSGLRQAVEPLS